MNKFLVIFDLNGTLVDTEIAFFKAYKDVLGQYDVPFSIEEFTSNWSTKGNKLHDFLVDIDRQDLFSKEKDILLEKDKIFQSTIKSRAVLMPKAKEAVSRIKKENYKIGLDSSTQRKNIDKILSLFKLQTIFDVIASGDMDLDEEKYGGIKKKSSRLKYIADSLGYMPDKTVVIGDAEKDIKGAKDAGMKVLAIPNQYTKENDFSLADIIINSLDDISIEELSDLFK